LTVDLADRVSLLEARVSRLESEAHANSGGPKPVKKGKSLSEWVQQKKPHSAVETAAVIGVYLERLERLKAFTQEDLRAGFRSAKEPIPVNIAETINKNIRKGHFAELPEKRDGLRLLYVTNTGEQFVEGLPRGSRRD
jgi:hypothetical protein